MPKKTVATLILFLSFLQVIAQDYFRTTIPEHLSKNANAVVQFENYSIELVSQDKMLIHHKAAITIFNKNAVSLYSKMNVPKITTIAYNMYYF